MIQRIQTVYLFFSALAASLLFFFPIASYFTEMAFYEFWVSGVKHIAPDTIPLFKTNFTLPLLGLTFLASIVPFISIFLYKKRRIQLRLLHFSIFIVVVLEILILLFYDAQIEKATGAQADYLSYAGIYFPLIALVFLLLALRNIRKDEKLIKSLDRIR